MSHSIYKNDSVTILLNNLSTSITKLREKYNKRIDVKIRSLIKEIKTRNLTDIQNTKFKRLNVRFNWI